MVRLKDFQILNLPGLNLGTCKFAVLIATLNPLENCSKYGANFMSDEKVLQEDHKVTKGGGGLIVIT